MKVNELSGPSLSFLGDAVYSLHVREYYLNLGYHQPKKLQALCNNYVSASGQTKVFERLNAENFFTEEEIIVYKRGRNGITHIPKNGSLYTYTTASGLEALVGYLYLTNQERLELFFEKMFEGGVENNGIHLGQE